MYEEEDATQLVSDEFELQQGHPNRQIAGMVIMFRGFLNRATTNNKWGIWGWDIDCLSLAAITHDTWRDVYNLVIDT